jgi:ribosome-binding factor A
MINLSKIFLGMLLNLLVLLFWVSTGEAHAQKHYSSVNVNKNNGKTTITVKNGNKKSFSLEFEGDITLSDDDKDITAISRGGYMEIKKSAFGNRRRIFMEPGTNGKLIKKYYVGRSEENFESEGRKWLAEILPEVLRSSTLGAKQRVNRFYKKGGTYAVLQEVGNMDSDHVKSTYIRLLLDKNPNSNDLIAILKVIGNDISSDHHQAEILKHKTKAFLSTDGTTAAYIEAAGKISSDHHKAEVLKKSIRNGEISENRMKSLFAITENISSDHHKAQVLLTVLKNRPLINVLIATSQSINSDHHKEQVLKAALVSPELSESGYSALLRSISTISSDHHSANVFSALLDKKLDRKSLAEVFWLADHNMSSDHHKAQVLKKAVQKQNLEEGNLEALLSALKGMSSDTHQAEVFKQLSKKSFNSDQLINILAATKSMSSDHHQSISLMAYAQAVREKGDTVKEAYRNACGSISSELHYGRAIRAIQ